MIRSIISLLFLSIWLCPAAQNLKAIYQGAARTTVEPISCSGATACNDLDPSSRDYCHWGFCAHTFSTGISNSQIYSLDMKANGDLVYTTDKSIGIYNAGQSLIFTPNNSGLANNWHFSRHIEPEIGPNGILWVPTWIYTGNTPQHGLMSWDGSVIDTFSMPTSSTYNYIIDLEVYPNGDVVLLLSGKKLVSFDGVSWTTTDLSTYPSLNNMWMSSLEIDPAGDLWLGGTYAPNKGQLAHFDGNTWNIHLSTTSLYGGLTNFTITSNGDKWLSGSSRPILHFDGSTWTEYGYYGVGNLPQGHGSLLKEGPNNKVWTTMGNGSLLEIDPSTGSYSLHDPQNSTFPINHADFVAIHPNTTQTYFVNYTAKGLGTFVGGNWGMISPEAGPSDEPYRAFLDLEEDGKIWYRGQFSKINCFFDGATWQNLPLTEEIFAIEVDQSGGLWMVTTDNTGFIKYYDGTTITNIPTPNGLYSLYSLAIDANGDLWGHTNASIWRYDGTNWTEYSNSIGNFSCGSNWTTINTIISDDMGKIWVSCGSGNVYSFNGASWVLEYTSSHWSQQVYADPQGNVWLTNNNEFRRQGPSGTLVFDNTNSPLQDVINSRLAIDLAGDIWGLSWENQEIIHFDGSNFPRYDMSALGFGLDTTSHLAFDLNGDLWLSNVSGVAQISLQTVPVDTVWPGDANDDLIANNFDLLALGQAFGSAGPVRINASLNWQAEAVTSWSSTLPSGVNYAHTDTDGSGTVNLDDTLAINLNYGLTHNKGDGIEISGGTPLLIVPDLSTYQAGDTVEAPIILGLDTLTADSVYGIAFSINYDPMLIDSGSLKVDYAQSWLGDKNQDMITLTRDDFPNGQVDLALSRTDQVERTGFGQIAKIRVVMIDDISGKNLIRDTLRLSISNVRLIRLDDTDIPYDSEVALVEVTQEVTSLAPLEDDFWRVFPNPAQDQLILKPKRSPQGQTQISLYTLQGQLLYQKTIEIGEERIDLPALPNALYLLQIQNEAGIYRQKLQIKR